MQALSAEQRGKCRQSERQHKDQRIAQAELFVRPQHDDHRQHEYGLQLKRQRQRKTRRRARGLSFQRKRQSPQRTGRVQAVALGEHAAVENDRRQKQHRAKRRHAGLPVLFRQRRRRASQKSIADKRNRFHRIERRHGQPRDDEQNILIQNVVFADILPHAAGKRACAQLLQPVRQIVFIISRGTLDKADPRKHRRRAERTKPPCAEQTFFAAQGKNKHDCQRKCQTDSRCNAHAHLCIGNQVQRPRHHQQNKRQNRQHRADSLTCASRRLDQSLAHTLIQPVKHRPHDRLPPSHRISASAKAPLR